MIWQDLWYGRIQIFFKVFIRNYPSLPKFSIPFLECHFSISFPLSKLGALPKGAPDSLLTAGGLNLKKNLGHLLMEYVSIHLINRMGQWKATENPLRSPIENGRQQIWSLRERLPLLFFLFSLRLVGNKVQRTLGGEFRGADVLCTVVFIYGRPINLSVNPPFFTKSPTYKTYT